MFNMYMHIKLQYILVHELTSLGGADTGHLAWRRQKIWFLRHKKICPQEICELAPLVQGITTEHF